MLLTNELVESESELQVMLHLPPWWNPTLEMSSPAVAATQTTNPVGFLEHAHCWLVPLVVIGGSWFFCHASGYLSHSSWDKQSDPEDQPVQNPTLHNAHPQPAHTRRISQYICLPASSRYIHQSPPNRDWVHIHHKYPLSHKWPFKLWLVPIHIVPIS